MMPYLTLNFIIALQGIFPSRNEPARRPAIAAGWRRVADRRARLTLRQLIIIRITAPAEAQ